MYGLKQTGQIANDRLKSKLAKHGYFPSRYTSRLWTHETNPIWFALVDDAFYIKYVGQTHVQHLVKVFKET